MINNRYILKNYLGAGRSKVFLCRDLRTGSDIAIKILSKNTSDEEKKLFINEYFLLRKLNHKNIIKVFERGKVSSLSANSYEDQLEPGDLFFTLEYAEGKSPDNFSGSLNEEEFLEIVKQISSVLLYLHASNLVYFDLKFENIFIMEVEGKFHVKFIDFGFTRRVKIGTVLESAPGSINYIAPEIIKKEYTDSRADLYSFGILLYRLIYSQFPFEGTTELDIVKEHVEGIFQFPATKFPKLFLDAINKLCAKNPDDRFQNILEFLDYLGLEIDEFALQDILPIPQLIGRERQLAIIDNWLSDKSSAGLINIKGNAGCGKTFLLQHIEEKYPDSFFVSPMYVKDKNFLIYFLGDLLFKYPAHDNDKPISIDTEEILIQNREATFDEIKKNLIDVVSKRKPLLIFDDLNLYPSFQMETLTGLFPAFQINGAKIIVTQNSSSKEVDGELKNIQTLHLTAFDDDNVKSFCYETFSSFFPVDDLLDIYLRYSNKLPLNLVELHRELYLLKILFTSKGNFKITKDREIISQLDLSQSKLHYLKTIDLTESQKNFINIISCFEKEVSVNVVSKIMGKDEAEAKNITARLIMSNILSFSSTEDSLKFSSESLKKFVYQNIADKKLFHKSIAGSLSANNDWNDLSETASQFEKAGDLQNAFKYFIEEIEKLEKVSAYNNIKAVLLHLKMLELDPGKKYFIDKMLCNVYKNIGDYPECLELLIKISVDYPEHRNDYELTETKGLCLMNTGNMTEAKKIFESLLYVLDDESKKDLLYFQIASIENELNNYSRAQEICSKITNKISTSTEYKGRAYNLLALTEIHANNNLVKAKEYFEKALDCYTHEKITHLVSRVKVNLGNIHNMLMEYSKAENYWNDALELNFSIGDLEHEAILLMNYGIYKFEKLDFEEAISFYLRANKIFETLENKKGVGLVNYNFAELYFEMCAYEKAFNFLREAAQIFTELDNSKELAAVFILHALFYFEFEDKKLFEYTFKQFNSLLKQKLLTESFADEIAFLTFLRKKLEKRKINKKNIIALIDKFYQAGQTSTAAKIYFQLIEYLISQKSYDDALELGNEKKYEKMTDKNLFWKAEKLYYIGLIYSRKGKKYTQQILDYYLEALGLIEKEQITTVTWKIILEICNFYAYRGIVHKAGTYLKYLNEILNYIISQFLDLELKWKYENSSLMKKTYNKIHSISHLIYK